MHCYVYGFYQKNSTKTLIWLTKQCNGSGSGLKYGTIVTYLVSESRDTLLGNKWSHVALMRPTHLKREWC